MNFKTRLFFGLKSMQYNFYVSRIFLFICYPIVCLLELITKKLKKSVKVNGKELVYNGNPIKFPKDVGINFSSQVFWNGTNGVEPLTVKTLSIIFPHVDYFLDIGSNFGIYSVLAQKVNEHITVYCFEPLPNIYDDNLSFHRVNNVSRYHALNCAVSNKVGEHSFFVPQNFHLKSEISSASLERDFLYNRQFTQDEIKIRTITLDYFMERNFTDLENKKVVIKIDVEGHESFVLNGGKSFLHEFRPWIVVEVDQTKNRLDLFLENISYSQYLIYCITNEGYFRLMNDSLFAFKGERDFLLLPAESIELKEYYSFAGMKCYAENILQNGK